MSVEAFALLRSWIRIFKNYYRDIILMIALLGMIILLGKIFTDKFTEQGRVAVVYVDGEKTDSFPLVQEGRFLIETSLGINEIEIRHGKASVIDSDCSNQICVKHSAVSMISETIVCLPHHFVLQIE